MFADTAAPSFQPATSARIEKLSPETMTAAAIILSSLGGAFELLGLIVVVGGIAQDRRQAGRFFAPLDPPQRPKRSYPGRISERSLGGPFEHMTVTTMPRLLERIRKGEASLANGLIGMRKAVDAELDSAIDSTLGELARRDNELRGHLRYLLAGSIPGRILGAIFLGLGIAFNTAGAITGTLA
jgi:hypothetical protein